MIVGFNTDLVSIGKRSICSDFEASLFYSQEKTLSSSSIMEDGKEIGKIIYMQPRIFAILKLMVRFGDWFGVVSGVPVS